MLKHRGNNNDCDRGGIVACTGAIQVQKQGRTNESTGPTAIPGPLHLLKGQNYALGKGTIW